MTAQFPVTDAAAEASLATIATNTPTVGQKASAASSPVVLASDQTLPLPTGAATAANQATANTSLATIAAAQGSGGTGIAEPAGGAGLLGWLSGIYQAVIGTLSVYTKNVQVTGNLTVADPTGVAAGSTVTVNTDSLGSLGIKLSGAPVGATVLFQGSVDGATWDNPKAYPLSVGAAGVQSATAAGDFEVNCAAFKQFRVCLSALTSGSFAVSINGTAATKHVGVKNGNPADLQATVTPASATLTDRSGSITAGATAQQLAASNTARKGWRLQNTSTGDLWFNDTGNAASIGGAGSFKVAAGGYYETPNGGASQTAISIYGATTGQTFSASEW